jgi:hypothetical protein
LRHPASHPLALAALVLSACASHSGSSAPSSPPTTSISPASSSSGSWTGSFQPVQQQSGNLTPHGSNRTYGSVALTIAPSSPNSTHAVIELSTTLPTSALLHWAIVAGRCGSVSLPLASVDQFPVIEVSNSGQGKLTADAPVNLQAAGVYHVDVFWSGGQDRSDVMACANLKMTR